jgi:hypothetical protein
MKARYIWLPLVIVSAFLAGTLVPIGKTQQKPPKYIEVTYMKVDPSRESDYVKFEREQWKPLHQERIKEGKLSSWHLFGVKFPFGTAEKYSYVTMNTFDQFSQLENSAASIEQVFGKVHPGVKPEDFISRTFKSRDLVRGEVWVLIDQAE